MKIDKIFFGMGNPGNSFEFTNHNLGADLLKEFLNRNHKHYEMFKNSIVDYTYVNNSLFCWSNSFFINDTSSCIEKLVDNFKISSKVKLFLFVDDVRLKAGHFRFSDSLSYLFKHSHNGLRSFKNFDWKKWQVNLFCVGFFQSTHKNIPAKQLVLQKSSILKDYDFSELFATIEVCLNNYIL